MSRPGPLTLQCACGLACPNLGGDSGALTGCLRPLDTDLYGQLNSRVCSAGGKAYGVEVL